MTRERMSRPSSSVPNQCARLGGVSRPGRSIAAGSCGANHGAKRANVTRITIRSTPLAASGLWRAFPAIRLRNDIAAVDMSEGAKSLPELKLEFFELIDQFEIGAVRCDQACAVRACCERDENVEVQIPQFLRTETFGLHQLAQSLARLEPILPCGNQNRMIAFQLPQKL